MPQIIVNTYSGGPTGHANVTFVSDGGSTVTYGSNFEGSLDHPQNGVRNEDAHLSRPDRQPSTPIEVTQQQYNDALAHAEARAVARAAGIA